MMRSSYLLIAVTGFAALIAQTLWYRYASQILGQSALTVAAVVAVALTGLAIGSHWGTKRASRSASNYVCGLGIAMLIAQSLRTPLALIEPNFVRWDWIWTLVVAIPLLPINFFAGAVFPSLLISNTHAAHVGRLSSVETLGGCAGAVFAGCFAIPSFGLMPTFVTTGILAIAAGLVGRAAPPLPKVKPSTVPQSNGTAIPAFVIVAVAIAGLASLGMEVVWQRLLILIVGTDSYSYTIVVTSYLMGIAIGAAFAAMWLRWRSNPQATTRLSHIAILQVFVAISSLFILTLVIQLAAGSGQSWINQPVLGFDVPLLKRFLLCIGLLLIPTSIQGAIFPLVVDSVAHNKDSVAAPAGAIYATIALGNVLGILASGFYLIPRYGLQQSAVILAVVFATAAVLLAKQKTNLLLIAATILLLVLCGRRWNNIESIGLAINPDHTQQLYYREGPANTVAVLAERSQPNYRRMAVDGIIIGQSGNNAEEKQLMLAHLPLLLNHQTHPIKRVAVIGLGSGLLSSEVAALPGVQSVTSVELSPAVIEANAQFSDLFPSAVATEINTVQADGIHWLSQHARSKTRFDAIISDGKSRPGHLGNAAFFSSDYYHSAYDCLTAHGKFVQWFSLDAAVEETKVVLHTFANAFPHAAIALAAPDSIYLIGSRQRIKMKSQHAIHYFNSASAQSLKIYHWCSADDVRSMGWIHLNRYDENLAFHPINTLDRPVLERFSFDVRPETLTKNKIQNLQWLKSLPRSNRSSIGLFSDDTLSKRKSIQAIDAMTETFSIVLEREKSWLDRASVQLAPALKTWPQLHRGALLSNSYLVAAEMAAHRLDRQTEIAMLVLAGRLSSADYGMQLKIGKRLIELQDAESALPHFLNAIETNPASGPANQGAAIALIKMQKLDAAQPYFQTALADPKIHQDAEFAKLESVFETANPQASPETSQPESPDAGGDILNQMRQLLEQTSDGK